MISVQDTMVFSFCSSCARTCIVELEFHTTRAHRLMVEVRTTFQRSSWRKDAVLLDSADVRHRQSTHLQAVAQQNNLNVVRGCATMASIRFEILPRSSSSSGMSFRRRCGQQMRCMRFAGYHAKRRRICHRGLGTCVINPPSWIALTLE